MTFVSFAEEQSFTDKMLHPVSHAAGSYALTHAGTVLCKNVTGVGKTTCSFIAGGATALIGIGVEMSQDQTAGNWKKGMAYDVLGIGLSIGIIHLDF